MLTESQRCTLRIAAIVRSSLPPSCHQTVPRPLYSQHRPVRKPISDVYSAARAYPEHFARNIGMPLQAFDELHTLLAPFLIRPYQFPGYSTTWEPADPTKNVTHLRRVGTEEMLWVALRLLRDYSHLRELEEVVGMDEVTAWRYLLHVCWAIDQCPDLYVKWPDLQQREEYAEMMSCIHADFSSAIGMVDGTLQHIQTPWDTVPRPLRFYTRKKFYGMSNLMYCDPLLRWIRVDAGFEGATHDFKLWRLSQPATLPQDYFSNAAGNWTYTLLADSGFTDSANNLPAGAWGFHRNLIAHPRDLAVHAQDRDKWKLHRHCRFGIEYAIGSLKCTFKMCSDNFRYDLRYYNMIWQTCSRLWNFMIAHSGTLRSARYYTHRIMYRWEQDLLDVADMM